MLLLVHSCLLFLKEVVKSMRLSKTEGYDKGGGWECEGRRGDVKE